MTTTQTRKYKISTFSEIIVLPNTLYTFDIDETILKIELNESVDWLDIYKECKGTTSANILAFREIIKNDALIRVCSLDNENMFKLINHIRLIGSHIIFLTARDSSLRVKTMEHLRKIGLDNVNDEDVYFNDKKGDTLYNIVSTRFKEVKNIVFIDDNIKNICDVQTRFCFSRYSALLYLIQHTLYCVPDFKRPSVNSKYK